MWANQNNQFYQQINKSDAIKIVARTSSVVKNLHTCMLVYMFLNCIFILRINKVNKKKKWYSLLGDLISFQLHNLKYNLKASCAILHIPFHLKQFINVEVFVIAVVYKIKICSLVYLFQLAIHFASFVILFISIYHLE